MRPCPVPAGTSQLAWQVVGGTASPQPSEQLSKLLGNVECMVQSVTPRNGDTSLKFESIVFMPKNRSGKDRETQGTGVDSC
jgi:hypothetical protein